MSAPSPNPNDEQRRKRISILSGSLRHVGIGSLLNLITSEQYSGWLTIEDAGTIGFCKGCMTCASTSGATGTRAVLELFLAFEGNFLFELGDCPHGPSLGPTMALMMEGCRLLDEWNRLSAMVLGTNGSLPADENRGLIDDFERLLDGRITVGELAVELAASPLDLIDPLLADLESGIVANVAPPNPQRARAAVSEHSRRDTLSTFELIDRSRDLIRAGDLMRAEITLRHVLRMEPDNRIAQQNLRHILEMRQSTD